MKNKRHFLFIAMSILLSIAATAQDCNLYSMKEGSVFGYQNLDGKGKVTGSARTTCKSVESVGSATVMKLLSEYADAKNSNQTTRELTMRCEDGKFFLDMQNFLDPKSMEAFKGTEVTVDGAAMIYPSNLAVGQTLDDANVTVAAASGGMSFLSMTITITNRKVVGTETITVPAGTFECYKITYDIETKMMVKITGAVTEYVNMGAGSVRTDTYDKKGKLAGSTVLSELKL